MNVMVALCTKDYGQMSESVHSSFHEVEFAHERRVPIIPIRLCSWDEWSAGMGGPDFDNSRSNSGRDQNQVVFGPSVIARDWSSKPWDADACALEIKSLLERKRLLV